MRIDEDSGVATVLLERKKKLSNVYLWFQTLFVMHNGNSYEMHQLKTVIKVKRWKITLTSVQDLLLRLFTMTW